MGSRKTIYGLAGVVLIFTVFASFSLGKPFMLDEIINIDVIKSVNQGNNPVGYWSEDLNYYMAAAHTTLTFYFLSVGYGLFEIKEIGTRLIPMIFCIGAIISVYLISNHISRIKKKGLVGALLFALSPLVIQVSTLVTTDMILLFFILLFIYVFIINYKTKIVSLNTLLLILILATIIWCKFANVPVLLFSIFLYSVIDRNLKNVLKIIIIGLFGMLLFGCTWFIYTKLVGVPFLNFLINNASYAGTSRLVSLFSFDNILLRIWTIKSIMFWTTPFFFILVLFALIDRIKGYIKDRKIKFIDFFIIFGFLIIIQYLIVYPSAYGFPKHFVVMVPGFSLLIVNYISKFRFENILKEKRNRLFLAVVAVIIFSFIFLKDPFIEHNIFYSKSITLEDNFNEYLISNLKGLLFFIPFFIVFLFLFQKRKMYNMVVISLFITIILNAVYVDYVQAKADYSTKWGYGESGVLEASDYIKKHTSENDIIISRGCIGHYSNRRYYMSYPNPNPAIRRQMSFLEVEPVDYPNNLNVLIRNKEVPYVVISHLEKGIIPEPEYKKVAEFGSFTIYGLS